MVNTVCFTKNAHPWVEFLSIPWANQIHCHPFHESLQTSPVRINPSPTSSQSHSVPALKPRFVTSYFARQIFVDVSMGPALTDYNLLDNKDCTVYIFVPSQVIEGDLRVTSQVKVESVKVPSHSSRSIC